MHTRPPGTLFLLALATSIACSVGPKTSDSAETTSATGSSGSSEGTSEGSSTFGPSTVGTSTASSTEADTSTTTTTTTQETTSSTAGPECEAIVGSRDCEALAAVSPDLDLATCLLCQGIACGQEADCDAEYPCVRGAIVLQGCCTDDDCADLTPFCGMFIGTNNVCVLHDDV